MNIFSNVLLALGYLPSSSRYEKQCLQMDERHAQFHSLAISEEFQRYLALDAYVNSPKYKTDINRLKSLKFEGGPEDAQLRHYKELKKRKEVKRYLKKGEDNNAIVLQEFLKLHDLVHSDTFQQRVAYLKNKNKYKESHAYQQFLEYQQLKQSNTVKQYFYLEKKYKAVFHERDTWKLLFADEFDGQQLSRYWSTAQAAGFGTTQANYVQNSEHHVIDASNISTGGNRLSIALRAVEQKGVAWDPKLGFIFRDFEYSAGLVNTANLFQLRYGKIEAKIHVPKVKNAYFAFWLNTTTPAPAISVFNICNNYLITGVYQDHSIDQSRRRLRLKHEEFYFVEMRWNKKMITWKVNGKEVARKANTVNVPLFLQFAAGAVGEIPHHQLPQHFDIDWIRVHDRRV